MRHSQPSRAASTLAAASTVTRLDQTGVFHRAWGRLLVTIRIHLVNGHSLYWLTPMQRS